MATQRELDHDYRVRKLHVLQQSIKYFLVAVVLILVARYLFLSVKELAGRTTTATLITKTLLAIRAPRAIAILLSGLFGLSGIGYGLRQRQRTKRIIARFHPERRQKHLETDPKKLSSGITLAGETGPDDQ